MSASVCCYTSFTYSYLPRARILAQTWRAAHPDWAIHAVMVDEPPPGLDPETALRDFDVVIQADRLGIPRFPPWMFKHDVVEACTAVKGHMLSALLADGYDKVIYLDPDIAVFHPLDSIAAGLEAASIILTPHQTEPNETRAAFQDNESTSMQYGVYNLGFIAVRNDRVGRSFAAWWAQRLHDASYDDVAHGVFTDQKYCDLVPGLFDRVAIERDPGCNVASWNLSRRTLRFADDGMVVNGSPLKFYHFTKIGGLGDVMTERYAGENSEVLEVWNWYKRRLAANTAPAVPPGYWHYGRFSNGEMIPRSARLLFRARQDLMAYFDDPFDTEGDSFYNWAKYNEPDVLEG